MKVCCGLLTVVGIAAAAASIAMAQPEKKDAAQPGGQPPLPPGWTEKDMQACMQAATPGSQHDHLKKLVGVWSGKTTMWMAPNTEPMKSECTNTITAMMDGRYVKCEMAGDMPGMGPFNGFGISGFDNVSQKYQSTWVDNCSTGIMNGTGDLSADGKTMTWKYNYYCPVTKKPAVMREIQKITGENAFTMEMYANEPKSGVEYKMMEIQFTRKAGANAGTGTR